MAPLLIPALLALGGTWLLLSRPKKSLKPAADTFAPTWEKAEASDIYGIIVEYGPHVSDEDKKHLWKRLERDDEAHPDVGFQLIGSPEPGIFIIVSIDGDAVRFLLDDPSDFDRTYEFALNALLRRQPL